MNIDIQLLEKVYSYYKAKKPLYDNMYSYYKGDSDAMKNYKMVTERSNNKTPVNFLKKFIKEEVSYSVGNDVTYISKSGNADIVNDIDYYLEHWSEQHDSDLMKRMLTYGFSYELYYIDAEAQFSSKIITPREGYAHVDDFGNILFFMRIYHKRFDSNVYIDVYDDSSVYHYENGFTDCESELHGFGKVPVSIAQVSIEKEDDTIYKDIKGLQDSYETNLSDISNEISDFRNAYLSIFGFQIEDKDVDEMKEKGIIQVPSDKGRAEWLIKNINDSFIQNTLSTQEDKMYQLTSHINHNEKMQSNLSGVALRSRLISLEEKCKLNQRALADCIKSRLKFLFIYLNLTKNKTYDYRDIKIKFTPNIPQDDTSTADIIQKLGDKLSTETGLAQLSFIENPQNEIEKIKKESELNKTKINLDEAAGE